MVMEKNPIIVFVTASSREEAERIAKALLEDKLIACANIIGSVHSIFWWQDEIDTAQEYLIIMKTRNDLFERVCERVKALHSYQIPEVIATPIVNGLKQYIKWLNESLE